MRDLGARPEGEFAGAGVEAARGAAGLHRHGQDAWTHEAARHDADVRASEGRVRVATALHETVREVGAEFLVQEWRVRGEGGFRIGDGGQRVVIDLESVHGIVRDRARFGDDRDDSFADKAGFATGQHLVGRRVVLVERGPVARELARDERVELGASHDCDHPRGALARCLSRCA